MSNFSASGPRQASPSDFPARIVVDLDAIRENTAYLSKRAGGSNVLAVVKADAYGHGLVPSAQAAVEAGANWLGTAQLFESLALRAHGYQGPLLTWLYGPSAPLSEAVAAKIDLSVSALWALRHVIAAARSSGQRAEIHLKADTGLSRNGASAEDWPDLVAAAVDAEREGTVHIRGVWSHFACADTPNHPSTAHQLAVFTEAIAVATELGARPTIRHVANSAATLSLPQSHFDMVRTGLALYGISPFADGVSPEISASLRPAMQVEADLALVKKVPAGTGVSYGHTYQTPTTTRLGLVPLGYADGIPRIASGHGPIQTPNGDTATVAGRVCMDQFIVDLGSESTAQAGDTVILFGDGTHNAPTVYDWAAAAQTIPYEIVSRIAPRIPRTYIGEPPSRFPTDSAPASQPRAIL